MEFGVVGLDGLVGTKTTTTTTNITCAHNGLVSVASSNTEKNQNWYGSRHLEDDDWRSSKLPKTESMLFDQKTTSLPSSNTLSFLTGNDNGQKQPQMLSFSCPKSEPFSVDKASSNSTLFPCFHLSSPGYNNIRNTGYGCGSLNGGGGMQTGAFTQSQWMELEHQALIYKYITANMPIPSYLLIPITKAVESARFSCFPASLLPPNSYGWGSFHVGYSGSTDPEPGRCRRTDGKKWRCSRDAVADQKYCERHINRGRHRSRKPVEGQPGHSAAAAAASTTTPNTANGSLAASSNPAASMVVGTQGRSFSISHQQQQQQLKSSQFAGLANPSAAASLDRTFIGKDCLISAASLLNPSQKSSSLAASSGDFGPAEGSVVQHSIRQFMDVWQNKSQSDCSVVSWPQHDLQSKTPELSISIPMVAGSPLRLSRGFDPMQQSGIGIGSGLNEPNPRQTRWIPVSWGAAAMGGPLGEVLNKTNNNSSSECKNLSVLNLMSKSWESSPRMGSSPTGVLQKTTFGSVSNSSAGSSPRADNKIIESGILCNDHSSTLLQHSSVI